MDEMKYARTYMRMFNVHPIINGSVLLYSNDYINEMEYLKSEYKLHWQF